MPVNVLYNRLPRVDINASEEEKTATKANFEPQLEPSVSEKLDAVRNMDSIGQQFRYMASSFPYGDSLFTGVIPQEEDIDALIDFAADPTASPSLIVRALAFDYAANAILSKDWDDPTIKAELDEFIPPNLQAMSTFIRRPQGEWYDEKLGWVHGERNSLFPARLYRAIALEVSRIDGLSKGTIVTEWNDHGYTNDFGDVYDDNIPATAFLLLESLSERMASYDRGSEPHNFSRFAKLIPLALEIQRVTYILDKMNIVDIAPNDMQEMEVDSEEIRDLLQHKESAEPYIEVFGNLNQVTQLLPNVFPEEYRAGVAAGATALFNDALYAVRAHLDNGGKTTENLPLNGGDRTLPLELGGDEPLALIQSMTAAIKELSNTLSDPSLGVTEVSKDASFQIYRLWKDGAPGSNVSVYIRPFGAGAYDGALEYGRNNEGVEASISYVVDADLSPDKIIRLGKTRGTQTDNRISIRLDREGIRPAERGKAGSARDPIQEEGTLSLDIGSVIGDDNWLGTKVGRFLAWGNVLRNSRLEQSNQLNHSTEYFTPQDGHAKTFGRAALVLSHNLSAKKLDIKQLTERLAGVQAVRATHNTK